MDTILYGKVKWFSTKGQPWGYIQKDEGGEVFVHYKNILPDNQSNPEFRTLAKDQRVEYKIAPGHFNDGTQAIEVRVLIGTP